MNILLIGADKSQLLPHIPNDNFLLIDDGPLSEIVSETNRTIRHFNPEKHSFNFLKNITPQKARDLANVFYASDPGGENTLTVRNGKRALAKLLKNAKKFDRITGDEKDPAIVEALGLLDSVLFTDQVRNVLVKRANFSLTGTIIAKLDRAKMGDFDCFVLANLLISQYQGTVIIPDFGFYQSPLNASLLRQERLIAGINSFDEVPDFKNQLIQVEQKIGARCTPKDAELLAQYAGLHQDPTRVDNPYNCFIAKAIGASL